MVTLLLHRLRLLPFFCGGHRQLAIENLALRQQLAVYKRTAIRPRLRTTDRLFWVGLARAWTRWRQPLVIVSETARTQEIIEKIAAAVESHLRQFDVIAPKAHSMEITSAVMPIVTAALAE